MRLSLLPLISALSPHLTRLTLIKVDSIISDIAEAFGTSELWSSLQYVRLESFLGMEPSTSQLQASDTAARVAIRQQPQIHVAPHGPPSPPTWVQFRHPAHNLTFLRLPALDYCPPTFGVHYGTAITACLILACNEEGYLSTSRDRHADGRINVDLDSIISPGHITTTLAPRNPKRYTQCGFFLLEISARQPAPGLGERAPRSNDCRLSFKLDCNNERNKARDTQCLISESKDSLITSHVAARTDETWVRKMLVFDVGLLII